MPIASPACIQHAACASRRSAVQIDTLQAVAGRVVSARQAVRQAVARHLTWRFVEDESSLSQLISDRFHNSKTKNQMNNAVQRRSTGASTPFNRSVPAFSLFIYKRDTCCLGFRCQFTVSSAKKRLDEEDGAHASQPVLSLSIMPN